jgi:hypothetical protein
MESSNPSFTEAKLAIANEQWDDIEALFDTSQAVVNFSDGNIEVTDGAVFYKGQGVNNHVVDRILDFMREGLPYKPLIRFLDKLMNNPSRRATNELYAFLEHKSMPLTPDGNFLAYKGVKSDYTDWYSGNFSNQVGETLEMTRNGVCDDANLGCSSGFHAGSLEYARGYGNGGHLMIVEISPADVVSVPLDCDCQKLRTSKYKVVSHFEKKLKNTLCDEYGDYGTADYDYEDDDEDDDESYDFGYNAGYDAAKKKFGIGVSQN